MQYYMKTKQLILVVMSLLLCCACGEKENNSSYMAYVYTKDTKCLMTYTTAPEITQTCEVSGFKDMVVRFYSPKEVKCYLTLERIEGNDTIKCAMGEILTAMFVDGKGYSVKEVLQAEAEGVVLPDSVRNHTWEIQYMLPHETEKTFSCLVTQIP